MSLVSAFKTNLCRLLRLGDTHTLTYTHFILIYASTHPHTQICTHMYTYILTYTLT